MTDEEIDTIMEMQCPDNAMAGVVERLIAALRESRAEAARLRVGVGAVVWKPADGERLPLPDETILMYTSQEDTVVGWYEGGLWHGGDLPGPLNNITHWAERPAGPEEVL